MCYYCFSKHHCQFLHELTTRVLYTHRHTDTQTDTHTHTDTDTHTQTQTQTHRHRHRHTHTHTHTRLMALCPGLPRWAGTRKGKPIWILLEQETVSGRNIRWAIWKSAPQSRQITMPAPQYSVFNRPDALPAAQPTASEHWRHKITVYILMKFRKLSGAIYTDYCIYSTR